MGILLFKALKDRFCVFTKPCSNCGKKWHPNTKLLYEGRHGSLSAGGQL